MKKRNKKILLVGIFLFVIFSVINQLFFQPKWVDGNTDIPQPSDRGVHEAQSTTDLDQAIPVEIFMRNGVRE